MKNIITPAVFIFIGIALIVFGIFLYKQGKKTNEWPSTIGNITYYKIFIKPTDQSFRRRAEIEYIYHVNGNEYQSSHISYSDIFTLPFSGVTPSKKYQKNQTVTVYFDPDNPSRAVLEPGVTITSLAYAAVGLALTLSSFAFLLYFYLNRKLKQNLKPETKKP